MRLPNALLALTLTTFGAVSVASAKGPSKGTVAKDILRKAPLLKIAPAAPKSRIKGVSPGNNRKLIKSYETAPPMVPHAVQDYLPIGLRNQCLGCHTNPPKSYRNATLVPASHYRTRTGKSVNKAHASVRKIYQGFYNCTMCHAPQTDAKPLVKNVFEGD